MDKYGLTINTAHYGLSDTNFVYLPDKYKMVSEDDTSDFLDFSYNYNDKLREWIAVTPDYDRNTHTITLLNNARFVSGALGKPLTYNQKNSRHRNRKDEKGKAVPIYPIVFSEILNLEESDVVID